MLYPLSHPATPGGIGGLRDYQGENKSQVHGPHSNSLSSPHMKTGQNFSYFNYKLTISAMTVQALHSAVGWPSDCSALLQTGWPNNECSPLLQTGWPSIECSPLLQTGWPSIECSALLQIGYPCSLTVKCTTVILTLGWKTIAVTKSMCWNVHRHSRLDMCQSRTVLSIEEERMK